MGKSIVLFLAAFLFLVACAGGSAAKRADAPRRQFAAVDTAGRKALSGFVANPGFAERDLAPSGAALKAASVFLAADLGLLDALSLEEITALGSLFFAGLPADGAVKEIVVPGLKRPSAGKEAAGMEKDGYFFVVPAGTGKESAAFRVESNVPIASYLGRDYDGYFIASNRPFFKNVVPARWTAVFGFAVKGDLISYRGVSYPVRAAPLYFSGTGIAPDPYLDTLFASEETPLGRAQGLDALILRMKDGGGGTNALLEKYLRYSIAFYRYIGGDFEGARISFAAGLALDPGAPGDAREYRCLRLERVLKALLPPPGPSAGSGA